MDVNLAVAAGPRPRRNQHGRDDTGQPLKDHQVDEQSVRLFEDFLPVGLIELLGSGGGWGRYHELGVFERHALHSPFELKLEPSKAHPKTSVCCCGAGRPCTSFTIASRPALSPS